MAARLHIKICKATNVIKMDSGKPNPYVTVRLKSQNIRESKKTKVQCNTFYPTWNQEFALVVTDPNDFLIINMYDEDIKNDEKMMNELHYPVYIWPVEGPKDRKELDIYLKNKPAGKFIFEVQAFQYKTIQCIMNVKAFNAKDVLVMDLDGKVDPYLRFRIKGKKDSTKQTLISDTQNPIWNQELTIISNDKNSDILQVDMLDKDIKNDIKMMDTIEIQLKNFKNGDVYEFDNKIRLKKKDAGHLHFKIDLITSNASSSSPQSKKVQSQKIKEIEEENALLRSLQEQQAQKICQLEKDNSELRSKLKKSNQSNNTNPKGSNPNKLKVSESIWFYQNQNKNIENCFVYERPTFEEILQELRENEYDLANSIDKSVIYQRDVELCLFEDQ